MLPPAPADGKEGDAVKQEGLEVTHQYYKYPDYDPSACLGPLCGPTRVKPPPFDINLWMVISMSGVNIEFGCEHRQQQ